MGRSLVHLFNPSTLMKSRFFLSMVCLVIFLSACEPPVTFTEPQPVSTGTLNSFPRKLRGDYFSPEDSSLLRIDSKTICRVYPMSLQEQSEKGAIDINISSDTNIHISTGEDIQSVSISMGDTEEKELIDTIFFIDKDHVVKKFKGFYFLNSKYENEGWEVQRLSLKKGKLSFNSISRENDIDDLKEIAESAEDTVAPYQFSVTKKQFKQFNRGRGFSHEEVFVKMK